MPSSENMEVEVRHGLSGVRTVVDDQPVTAGIQTEAFGDFRRLQQQVAKDAVILGLCFRNPGNRLLRHEEDVNGRGWLDITNRETRSSS